MAKVKVSPRFKRLCDRFGAILGGELSIEEGPVCLVSRARNIRPTILGRRAVSPLTRYQFFSFESLDKNNKALCLGETAVFESQVNRLLTNLRKEGIKVTAVHNHWLKDRPRLIFMHWETIENPVVFAKQMKRALAFLND